jgi:signal transduction histidine kinase
MDAGATDEGSVEGLRSELEDVRASRSRIAAAAEGERRTMERELHDGAQQQLIALSLKVQLARELADTDPGALADLLDGIADDVRETLDDLRGLAWRIYPSLLLDGGLVEALRAAAADLAIPTRIEAAGTVRCPTEVESAVYFCCLDALRSAAEDAGPDARATVAVRVEQAALAFDLTVKEAGPWPDGALAAARDRIEALGGQLTVSPGAGLSGTVPLVPSR